MSDYICNLSSEPIFTQKGLACYPFEIQSPDVQVKVIDVETGHDTYIVCKKCTHIFYVIEGEGSFEIDDTLYSVKPHMLIEVPPHVEFTYTGKMKLLLIMNPHWFEGNEEIIRENPNVK